MKTLYTFIICLIYTTNLWGEGTVRQVAGDLAYVTGLNGSAPIWSILTVGKNAEGEVIKVLSNELVVRITQPNGTKVRSGDTATLKSKGKQISTRRPRRTVYATRVDKGPQVDGDLTDPVWSKAIPIEGFAGAIHVVTEPSVHNPADGKLAFKNLGRKLYPYDEF